MHGGNCCAVVNGMLNDNAVAVKSGQLLDWDNEKATHENKDERVCKNAGLAAKAIQDPRRSQTDSAPLSSPDCRGSRGCASKQIRIWTPHKTVEQNTVAVTASNLLSSVSTTLFGSRISPQSARWCSKPRLETLEHEGMAHPSPPNAVTTNRHDLELTNITWNRRPILPPK